MEILGSGFGDLGLGHWGWILIRDLGIWGLGFGVGILGLDFGSRFGNFGVRICGFGVRTLGHPNVTRVFPPPLHPLSFKACIPRSFRLQIQQDSAVTRLRMKNVFRKFVRRFQRHTVGAGTLTEEDVMFKYLATLELLAPRFGTERFAALSLDVSNEGEKAQPYINGGHAMAEHGDAAVPGDCSVSHEVLVSGTGGIQWRPVPSEVSLWGVGMGLGWEGPQRW